MGSASITVAPDPDAPWLARGGEGRAACLAGVMLLPLHPYGIGPAHRHVGALMPGQGQRAQDREGAGVDVR